MFTEKATDVISFTNCSPNTHSLPYTVSGVNGNSFETDENLACVMGLALLTQPWV